MRYVKGLREEAAQAIVRERARGHFTSIDDLARRVWEELSPSGDPLAYLKRHRGVEVGGVMYVFAGYDFRCADGAGPGQVWNTSVFSFDPRR